LPVINREGERERKMRICGILVPRFSIAVNNDDTRGKKYNKYKGASARAN